MWVKCETEEMGKASSRWKQKSIVQIYQITFLISAPLVSK